MVLDRQRHRLHTCNLGDSGFLVVRAGEVVHRSDEQQHYFNTPFQLSIAPPGAEGVVLSDRSVAHPPRSPIFHLAAKLPHCLCSDDTVFRRFPRVEYGFYSKVPRCYASVVMIV